MGIIGHKEISGMFRNYEVFQERWQMSLLSDIHRQIILGREINYYRCDDCNLAIM
jgi:hypothetical protein